MSNLEPEKADFSGRVYLRNNYDTNQIYDDISDQFTGIGATFTLTVGGANTTGIGSTGGNGVLFINGIFQTPSSPNNPDNNFSLNDYGAAGITSVTFSELLLLMDQNMLQAPTIIQINFQGVELLSHWVLLVDWDMHL